MKKSNHILWIDCAKAIGIFLVVLGHLWYKNKYPIINQYIYSFHIPLFFILSGFVFNYNKKIKFKEYTKLKFFRILLPTIIFLLLGVIKLYLSGIHSLKSYLYYLFFIKDNVHLMILVGFLLYFLKYILLSISFENILKNYYLI